MGKFDALNEHQTNGANYDIMTDDIIAKLEEWDAKFGVEISNVRHNQVNVRFLRRPEDEAAIANEVYELCPDIIEQHFGCMAEMVEAMEEFGQDIDPKLQTILDQVDFDNPEYGMDILRMHIERCEVLPFWWD